MSDLDIDYSKIEQDISDKIRNASALLIEAGKLMSDHHINMKADELENLLNIMDEITPEDDWDQSNADNWISSSNNC